MSEISSCFSKFSFLWVREPSCRHCPDSKVAQGYLHAFLCLTQIATLDCEFQPCLLSLSPCCHSFLKSLMLGCPFHPILLSHLSREICTGVFWGCVMREEKGSTIKTKKDRKKVRIQTNTTTDMTPIQKKLKPTQANETKTSPKPQQPEKPKQNQAKNISYSPGV